MSEKFILVSLDEEKSKKLAEVIGNETSRKILDFLGGIKEASESEISEKLDIPISTVHYNIQHLVKAGLIESKEFKWSEKGREINIYRIAKKYVVIAPKGVSGLKEKLKSIFPLFLISGVVAILIQFFIKSRPDLFIPLAQEEVAKNLAHSAIATGAAETMADAAVIAPSIPNYGLWFFIGALFVLVIYLIFRRKR